MKYKLSILNLLFCVFLSAQSINGEIFIGCNSADPSDTHSVTVPYNSRMEFASGGFNVTGGQCPDVGTANVNFNISVYASYQDSEGNNVYQTVAATGTFSGSVPPIETNSIEQGVQLDIYISMSVGAGQYANAPYSFNLNFIPLTYSSDNEPNNTFTEAIDTFEGQYYEGHGTMDVGPNTVDNYDDWFKLTAPRNGTLTIFTQSDNLYSGTYSTNVNAYRSDTLGNVEVSDVVGSNGASSTSGQFNTTVYCVKEGDILYIKYNGSSNSYRFNWLITEPSGFIDAEPNDTNSNAIAIMDGETKTGNIGYGLTRTTDNNSTEDIEDWYSFTLPSAGDVSLSLTSDEFLTPINSQFYGIDANGNLEVMPLNGNQTDGYFGTCLAAGNYVFKVSINPDNISYVNFNGGCDGCCANYTLALNFSNLLSGANDPEIGNNISDAIQIPANTSIEGQLGSVIVNYGVDNQDFYEIITDFNGDLTIDFITPFPEGNAYLQYMGNNGFYYNAGTANLDANGMITSITYPCASEGEIFVLGLYSSNCFAYEFSYTNSYYGDNNENEPNNSLEDAETLNENDDYLGHINYGTPTESDPADFYKIIANEFAPLEIFLVLEDNTYINVYENNANINQYTQDSNSGLIESIYVNNAFVGSTYDLEVRRNDNMCGSYEILGWNQAFTSLDDLEPNNDINSALSINFNENYEGRLSYYNALTDNEDYYTFTLSENDDVEFILDAFEGLFGNASLTLFDSSNNQVFQVNHDGTNSSRTTSIVNLNAGTYYFIITGTDQTGSYSFTVTPQNTLGILEMDISKSISLYPNPTKGLLYLGFGNNVDSTINAKVFDVTGKIIDDFKIDDLNYQYNTTGLKNGVYFIQLKSNHSTTTKRFIKQ